MSGRPSRYTARRTAERRERERRARERKRRDRHREDVAVAAHRGHRDAIASANNAPVEKRRDRAHDTDVAEALQGLFAEFARVSIRAGDRGRVHEQSKAKGPDGKTYETYLDIEKHDTDDIGFLITKTIHQLPRAIQIRKARVLSGSATISVPSWVDSRDKMKLLGFVGALCDRQPALFFTVHLVPGRLASSFRSSRGFMTFWMDRLSEELSRELARFGIARPTFFFIPEFCENRGWHLHGVIVRPFESDLFDDHVHLALKAVSGLPSSDPRAVDTRPVYYWPGLWEYLTKGMVSTRDELLKELEACGRARDVKSIISAPKHVRSLAEDFYDKAHGTGRPLWTMGLGDYEEKILRERLAVQPLVRALKPAARKYGARPWIYVEEVEEDEEDERFYA